MSAERTILLALVCLMTGAAITYAATSLQPQAASQQYETVLCKRGQGQSGEYAHFRRKYEGLDLQACGDFLEAYRMAFPQAAEPLFCSATPRCP